jgi:hypothetical protein
MCVAIGKYCDGTEIAYLFAYVKLLCYVDELQMTGSKNNIDNKLDATITVYC